MAAARPQGLGDCVVAQQGDAVSGALARLPQFEQSFRAVLDITAPGLARVRGFPRIGLIQRR